MNHNGDQFDMNETLQKLTKVGVESNNITLYSKKVKHFKI